MSEQQRARERGDLAGVLTRNIHALAEVHRSFESRRNLQARLADVVTTFAGSMKSVILHAMAFGGWIIVNTGVVPGVKPFDPFPFVMLAMFASVEAIFLSTFVLISQNRMSELADKRAELALQINLLAEHEVTRLVQLVDGIAQRLGVDRNERGLDELKKDVRPEVVVDEIEKIRHDVLDE
jgi:uncharacterized membrane protein